MNQHTYKWQKYKKDLKFINNKLKSSFNVAKENKSINSILSFIVFVLITPFIYLISPFKLLYDLLTDKEYSKDYLEYQIERNNYNPDQALIFLKAKNSEYQRRKLESLLNYSDSKHNTINETFLYLFEKYGDIVLISNQQEVTKNKTDKEQQEIKNAIDFQSNLEEAQIELLIQCINELRIFETSIDANVFKSILSCKIENPIKINRNKNKLFAYLFCELSYRNLIGLEWQAVCANNNLFMSYGGVVLTQNNYSSTVYDVKENPPKDSHIIDNYLKQLQKH